MKTMENLSTFVSIPSISGNVAANIEAIDFLTKRLTDIDFKVSVKGQNQTDQPAIIAHRKGVNSKNKIVIYGHYDVVDVFNADRWKSENPFVVECIKGRLFGRGIADNKGILNARLAAVETMYQHNESCPEILWLIQGEEEVVKKDRVAIKLFSPYLHDFDARLYLDETGFNDIDSDEQLVFLWSKKWSKTELLPFQNALKKSPPFSDTAVRFEYRHLNKLAGTNTCPLLSNLPEDAVYIGFGPNDKLHLIHRDNESLNKDKLVQHQEQFSQFLSWCHHFSIDNII